MTVRKYPGGIACKAWSVIVCGIVDSDMARQNGRPKVALFLGAGFSKPWGLPLASEIMGMESVREEDYPLTMAWRSNPEIYKGFYQQSRPLKWEEHIAWYASRNKDWRNFINNLDMISVLVGMLIGFLIADNK